MRFTNLEEDNNIGLRATFRFALLLTLLDNKQVSCYGLCLHPNPSPSARDFRYPQNVRRKILSLIKDKVVEKIA